MRVVISGSFIDYELQFGNFISKLSDVLLVLPKYELPGEFYKLINSKVNYYIFKGAKPKNIFGKIPKLIDLLIAIHHFKPDVVHLQLGGDIADFSIFMYSRIFRIKTIITCHDVKPHKGEHYNFAFKFRLYIMRTFSNAIIVHGEKLRQQMIETYRMPPDKVFFVHIGEHEVAPFKLFERSDIKEEKNSILFFGRIYEYKGLKYLIKAEPMITEKIPNCKIVIAGTGENFGEYNILIGDRRQHFVIHNYRISYQEGAELFKQCSVVVLPYVEASQSGVVPTAYGFKKPIIATNVGSIDEIVDDGKTGLIVPCQDPRALAEAIIKLLNDDELRKKWGKKGLLS